MKEFYDEKEKPWDGDFTKIPENGVLVAYDTTGGLRNGVVIGYHLTYRKGLPQVRIKLCDCGSMTTNERFIEELVLPMTKREKDLRGIK